METFTDYTTLTYMQGFDREFQSEASGFEGSLPDTVNPAELKHNLRAEKISGSPYSVPHASNKRSWLYRKRPSVCQSLIRHHLSRLSGQFEYPQTEPNHIRWCPFKDPDISSINGKNFLEGLQLLALSNSDGFASSSVTIYVYMFNKAMTKSAFVNTDGDYLFVPQEGELAVRTEFGRMLVKPNEICVIQRGMVFSIDEQDSETTKRGYILEVRGNHFELASLGQTEVDCLAKPNDFQVPTAFVEVEHGFYHMYFKFQNEFFYADRIHSPYDVAAWSGNYTPYKYDLTKFVDSLATRVNHHDPSIYNLLTCPSMGKPEIAIADFVIVPPNWQRSDDYYQRSSSTEFMGLIRGRYKSKSLMFAPGGAILHHSMIAHGPDIDSYESGSSEGAPTSNGVADDTLAFIFKTSLSLKLSTWATTQLIDRNYQLDWERLNDVEI